MPVSQVPPARPKPLVRLLVLTLFVGLAHAALLGAVPSQLGLGGSSTDTLSTASFATRMIAPQPPQLVPAAQTSAEPARTPPAAAAPQDSATPTSPPETALSNTPAEPPVATAAASATDATATSMDGMQLAAASKAAEPAKPGAPAPSPALQLPPSIRMLYDGKGEEKSFIKYAANAELLWQQDGSQYNARLEITYMGFRLRTWTSKGSLDNLGLEPIRFGDKPRGAEQATHFQRDKGIISFSANNPDVPLQAGAQDKLSALLQLSALVAGAPERFPTGSSISFQAADAHNAESWNFQVGPPEVLELPAGPTKAIKLAKAATAEYGQGMEVWLAPEQHYLPVRLRLTESSGAVVDLLWRKTEKAE